MAPSLHHFYHLFVPAGAVCRADAIWREHVHALRSSGLAAALDSMHLSIVGEAFDAVPPPCRCTVERFETGHEMVTLRTIQQRAATLAGDALVSYCHSKGVTYPPRTRAALRADSWRRAMLAHAVHGWRDTVPPLTTGRYDTSGPFFLEAEAWRYRVPHFGNRSYFAGNFWWSRVDHLRRLPPVALDVPRHAAEVWVGLVPPRPFSRSLNVFPSFAGTARMRVLHALQRRGVPVWKTPGPPLDGRNAPRLHAEA